MARQRTLTPLIGVRIPVPQPFSSAFQTPLISENAAPELTLQTNVAYPLFSIVERSVPLLFNFHQPLLT